MMLETHKAQCPYCGEIIQVLVDTSSGTARYWEDCQVCCRPITLTVTLDLDDDTQAHVEARSEEE